MLFESPLSLPFVRVCIESGKEKVLLSLRMMPEKAFEERLLVEQLQNRRQYVRGTVQTRSTMRQIGTHFSQLSVFRTKDRQSGSLSFGFLGGIKRQQHFVFIFHVPVQRLFKDRDHC